MVEGRVRWVWSKRDLGERMERLMRLGYLADGDRGLIGVEEEMLVYLRTRTIGKEEKREGNSTRCFCFSKISSSLCYA